MLFSELEAHPLFTKSYHSYGTHGMVMFFPAPEKGMEIVLGHEGTEHPVYAVQHMAASIGSRVVINDTGGYIWCPLDSNITFNVYSRKLESVL